MLSCYIHSNMKHRVFFLDGEKLIEYLQKYNRGLNSKDYEFFICLHAKTYWEKKLKQDLIIVFEQNSKMHSYPERFTPTLEQLKEILRTYNEENTPVDFGLAPVSSTNEFEGFAYPFQVKKYISTTGENNENDLAAYINKKANGYRASDTCLIIVPQLMGAKEDQKGFNIAEVRKLLKIDEKAIRAVYVFQFFNGTPNFIPLWASAKALAESV